jgi:O-antigen/teichoic acid export membrane protein
VADPSPESTPDATPPDVSEVDDRAHRHVTDVGSKVASGLKWKVVSQVVSEGSRVAVAIVLAHLLTPTDYGIVGMAFVVSGFVSLVADPWLGAAIVQRERITEEDRSTVFWMSVGIGTLSAVVSIALSGAVANFFGQPKVQWLFASITVGFVIRSLATTHQSLLERDMAFRTMELRGIAGTLAGGAVAVPLALAGAGPWAIVANSLAGAATSTVLLWVVVPWRPRLMFSMPIFRSVGSYTLNLFGSRVLGYANVSSDNFLIGRFLGAAPLGAYSVAYNVMFTPMLRIAYPLQDVLFPAFANLQETGERLEVAWLRSKEVAAAVLAPLFLATLAVAPDFVSVVLGSRWDDSIQVLRILCLSGVAYSLGTLNWSLLMALGKGATLFRLNIVVTTLTVAAYGFGLRWGIVGVAVCGAIVRWLLVVPETYMATRSAGVGFVATLRATTTPLPFAFAATGVALLVRAGLVNAGVPAAIRILLVGGFLLVVYAALLYVGSRPMRREMRRVAARASGRWRALRGADGA